MLQGPIVIVAPEDQVAVSHQAAVVLDGPHRHALNLFFGALVCAVDFTGKTKIGKRTSLWPPDKGRADTLESVSDKTINACPHIDIARLTSVGVVCRGQGVWASGLCPYGFLDSAPRRRAGCTNCARF